MLPSTWKSSKRLSASVMIVFISILFVEISHVVGGPLRLEYMQERAKMIAQDRKTALGSKMVLDTRERIVSDYLVKEKRKLIESSRLNSSIYYPALSFFKNKALVEASHIYKLIQIMPKGAVLHTHDQGMTSLYWLVKNVTYRDNLYMCVNDQHFMIFHFMEKPVPNPGCEWKSVKEERAKAANIEEFDESIRRNLSLLYTDPLTEFKDVGDVWKRFSMYFKQVDNMVLYVPVFRDYFAQALKEFYEDNVQYMELRGRMWGTFDLDGTKHDAEFGLNIYRNVTNKFVQEHPDFAGAKFIMCGRRYFSKQDIMAEIKVAMDLHKRYPDSYLGYDLDNHEDAMNPLLYYIDDLLYPSEQMPPYKLPYFFHAAETDWQDSAGDYNLVDALLLNTTRIGHGYALAKHPYLAEKVKKDQIAVEVNPISNQVLGLVKDLRNHPMVPLMADDFPIVISSDDSATWEASPLSHDFYMAFMNMCGEDVGLGFLKQLAINSIQYSGMTEQEKMAIMTTWRQKWNQFITESIEFIVNTATNSCNSDAIIGYN